VHEFSVKQYATDSSRISLKILIFWDVTMLLRTSIYDVGEDHTQYNTKRRKLLFKRYGVTFHILLAFGLAAGIPSHTHLTVTYSELYNWAKKGINVLRCSLPVPWRQTQPSLHTPRRRQPQPLFYKPPALRRCKLYKPALRDLRLHDLFKVATVFSFLCYKVIQWLWSEGDDARSDTDSSTAVPTRQFVGPSAFLTIQWLYRNIPTQSDTSNKGGVKRLSPHYSTFCKCVPCDFTHTGSLFKLTTDGYHFL
jgi:hypothetical protein